MLIFPGEICLPLLPVCTDLAVDGLSLVDEELRLKPLLGLSSFNIALLLLFFLRLGSVGMSCSWISPWVFDAWFSCDEPIDCEGVEHAPDRW